MVVNQAYIKPLQFVNMYMCVKLVVGLFRSWESSPKRLLLLKYTESLTDFISIFQVLNSDWYSVCKSKNTNTWHDCYALTTTKEAYTISFNSQNILSVKKGFNTPTA